MATSGDRNLAVDIRDTIPCSDTPKPHDYEPAVNTRGQCRGGRVEGCPRAAARSGVADVVETKSAGRQQEDITRPDTRPYGAAHNSTRTSMDSRRWSGVVAIQQGVAAGGSQAPVVNIWSRASRLSMPHLVAVDR